MCFEKTTGMRMGGSVMSEEEFAGNLGSSSSGGIRDFEVQRNTVTGAAGRGSGQYLDDRGPGGGRPATGPDTIEAKMKQVRSVFGGDEEDGDPAQDYMDFMQNYRNAPFTKAGNALGELFTKGPSMSLARSIFGGKPTPSAIDRSNAMMQSIFDYAGKNPGMVGLKDDGLGMFIDTGTGMINMRDSGLVTYSGRANPDYTGPFQDLVNPKSQSSEDDADRPQGQTPLDPCPEGFKFNAETQQCEPVADDTADDAEDKPSFTRNPTPISTVFPDLTRYGREGGEYQFFASMPGVPDPNLAEGGPPRGPQGEVTGPGGPKDDLVGPFMLSSREYVLPYEMVLDEGQGSYDKGIKSLEKQRMAALKKYKARAASS